MASAVADEISPDVFDVIMGFGDFEEFKELMLSYKDQVAYEKATSSGTSTAGGGAGGAGTDVPAFMGMGPVVTRVEKTAPAGASTSQTLELGKKAAEEGKSP